MGHRITAEITLTDDNREKNLPMRIMSNILKLASEITHLSRRFNENDKNIIDVTERCALRLHMIGRLENV